MPFVTYGTWWKRIVECCSCFCALALRRVLFCVICFLPLTRKLVCPRCASAGSAMVDLTIIPLKLSVVTSFFCALYFWTVHAWNVFVPPRRLPAKMDVHEKIEQTFRHRFGHKPNQQNGRSCLPLLLGFPRLVFLGPVSLQSG